MEKWFDVTILEEGDNYTDVQLTVDHIIYRIQDGKTSGYNTIIFKIQKRLHLTQLLRKVRNIDSSLKVSIDKYKYYGR